MDTDADFPATVIAAQYRDRKFALDRELGICTNGRGSHEQALRASTRAAKERKIIGAFRQYIRGLAGTIEVLTRLSENHTSN